MKFFTNIPKKQYSTEIGNLTISSFYSFFSKQTKSLRTNNVVIDDNTTLVEASLQVYSDTDSTWAFLVSTNIINPFNTLPINSTNYLSENEVKTSYNPVTTTSSSYYGVGITFTVPVGSIAARFNIPSGASWEYSSIGNFNLDGPFSLIEESNSTNLSVTTKVQADGTGITLINQNSPSGFITYIAKGDTYYSIPNSTVTRNNIPYTKSAYKEVADGREILYKGSGGTKYPASKFDTENPNAVTVTIEENAKNTAKQINTISPLDISSSISSIVTPKYSGL